MKTRTKRRICLLIALAGLAFAYGAVGGMDWQPLEYRRGLLYIAVGLAVFAGALYKGGHLR